MKLSQLRLLSFTLNGKYYINSTLPFGASSSCLIFEKVARILQWIVINETKNSNISHYLDDFPLFADSMESLTIFMNQFYDIMNRIGMPVAKEKTLGPTQLLEYLGLLIDMLNQCVGIPEKKRKKCLEAMQSIIDAKISRVTITVREIQQVAGKLNFICQALPAGKPFLHDLYALTCGTKGKPACQGHHKRISASVCSDMMFKQFLLETAHLQVKSVPFLIKLGIDNDQIELYSDSAGAADKGFSCRFGVHWAQGFWSHTNLFTDTFSPNIALLELYAITVAFEIWALNLSGKSITLKSDNAAAVAMINCKRSDIPAGMDLIRHLTKTCLHFQIFIQAKFLPSAANKWTDLLSRNRMTEFRQKFLEADLLPTSLPTSLWPLNWTQSQMLSDRAS